MTFQHKDKLPRWISWSVMALICILVFGNYYTYDIPSTINKQIQEYLEIDDADFASILNLFYSLYSLPNIFLPFVGGWLIDRYGVRSVAISLACTVLLGQLLFTWGMYIKQLYLMYLGRAIFGIGGESLGVAQSTFAALWFGSSDDDDTITTENENVTASLSEEKKSQKSYLALAVGLNLAVGRMGSVVNDFLSPYLAIQLFESEIDGTNNEEINSKGVILACWIGVVFCSMSFFCTVLLSWLDKRYRSPIPFGKNVEIPSMRSQDSVATASDEDAEKSWEILRSTSTLVQTDSAKPHETILSQLQENLSQIFKLAKKLNLTYWLACVAMIFSYGTIIPFNTIHSAFLQTRFDMDPVTAGQIMAIPDSLSLALTPLTGSFADYFGFRIHILIACSLLLIGVHLTLGFATEASILIPNIPLALLGICYSFLLVFWPVFTLLVPKQILSTSYGLASCLLNLSLTVFPMLVAYLISVDDSYFAVEMLFVACACICLVVLVWVARLDALRHGGLLKRGSRRTGAKKTAKPTSQEEKKPSPIAPVQK